MANHKGAKKVGGRKKGTPNKDNKLLKEAIRGVIDMEEFKKRLKQIKSPAQYCQVVLQLLRFTTPMLKSVEHTGENKQLLNIILPDRIRPEDIKEILEDAEEEEL